MRSVRPPQTPAPFPRGGHSMKNRRQRHFNAPPVARPSSPLLHPGHATVRLKCCVLFKGPSLTPPTDTHTDYHLSPSLWPFPVINSTSYQGGLPWETVGLDCSFPKWSGSRSSVSILFCGSSGFGRRSFERRNDRSGLLRILRATLILLRDDDYYLNKLFSAIPSIRPFNYIHVIPPGSL